MADQMRFASATTTERDWQEASQALAAQIEAQMNGLAIHLAVIFLSPHFRAVARELTEALRAQLDWEVLIGCTAEGVIGKDQEIERLPAVTLVTAHLPEVELTPFTLQSMNWEKLLADPRTFYPAIGAPNKAKLFMVLADPFTTPIEHILNAFNSFYPDLPLVGGMASGSTRAGGNALLFNDRLLNNGAVGVAFSGAFEADVIVSQGCRPIGQPVTVTSATQNMIYSLDGETPLIYLQKLIEEISPQDRELLQGGLYLGRAIVSDQETLGRGDFLIRGVLGLDRQSGAMVVGDSLETGETIQFHLRDASTAAEDLEMMLAPQLFYDPPSGGFLFSCNGRGTRLYNHPNGDINAIQKVIGEIHLAGFFCAGELGPIGGKNFLHGHTASLVLFRPQPADFSV